MKHFGHDITGATHSVVDFFQSLSRYPSALAGLAIILILIIVSIGTMIKIPYSRVIPLWRGDNQAWIANPIEAQPAWTNLFRKDKLPETIQVSSQDNPALKEIGVDASGNKTLSMTLAFDYEYDTLPQDVLVKFDTITKNLQPFVSMRWVTPDGRIIQLNHFAVTQDMLDFFSQDYYLTTKFYDTTPVEALFGKPGGAPGEALPGHYELRMNGFLFEPDSNLDTRLVVYGRVYGLAGTDGQRKDLLLVLLWGTAVALSFGILAAVGTTLCSVTLAAMGAWFGGWVDGLIHRISEVNMVLPILPTSLMIFYLYSKSFWVLLGVTVGLSIFGNSIKNYRAMFMQIKTHPYVETAVSYGSSNWRVILKYLLPRVQGVLIPQLIILVPSYVFFEATLSFLGVSDPLLPTLGKQLLAALNSGMYGRPVYLLLEPILMLVLISIGFPLVGFALERLYHEKLGV